MRRKTDEEFKQEVYEIIGDSYTFIDHYVNSTTKLRVKHNKCGNTYKVRPNDFLNGNRCPYCSGRIKKTDEQFKQEIYDLVGNDYIFLDYYVNDKTKLRVKHNKCGNIYKVTPNNFLNGNRCPQCINRVRKTNAQFKQEVYELAGDEYTFLGSYINSSTKIRVKHNKCGNTYKVMPNSFIRGSRCPYCYGHIKKTDKQFKQEVYDLVCDTYTFLDPYVNNKTKLRVKHSECGNIYEVMPSDFLNGVRCPYCFGTPKKTDAQFKQEVYNLVGNKYTFLEHYLGANTKIKVKHNKCGSVYEVTPSNFLRGSRCPDCFGTPKKTDKQFRQEVYDLVENDYTFLDNYIDSMTKIRVKHNKCGVIYEVRPAAFLFLNNRCPYCNSPKGELMIDKILKYLKINYKSQKTFGGLKDKSYLSYDFYIPSQNILIEYQGIQHYRPIDHFGGEDTFMNQQKHDKMKSDYAEKHGYNLIAVPYTVDTLPKIKKYLIKHGLTS